MVDTTLPVPRVEMVLNCFCWKIQGGCMRLALGSLGLLFCAACETVTPQSGGTHHGTRQMFSDANVSIAASEYTYKEWSDAGTYLRYFATNKTPHYLCVQINETQRMELVGFWGGVKAVPPNGGRVQVAHHFTRRSISNWPRTTTSYWPARHLAPDTQPTWQDCDSSRPAQ
ncbi:hypothetical protein [Hyphomonas sp.]|uniref:hypothetical protein n=1 Tax=Hyphomonas sp. TaxID=87 RepID=UPI00391D12BB